MRFLTHISPVDAEGTWKHGGLIENPARMRVRVSVFADL
jgi:hypothetical protein